MELMSTPCPVEPPAQPLPPLNVKPIEAESEKQNQTAAPVPVKILTVPISAPVVEPLVSNMSTVITILPKANLTVSATNTRKQVAYCHPRAYIAMLKWKTQQTPSRSQSLRTRIQTFLTKYATPSPATTHNESATIASSS
jgi:hypothetical protein